MRLMWMPLCCTSFLRGASEASQGVSRRTGLCRASGIARGRPGADIEPASESVRCLGMNRRSRVAPAYYTERCFHFSKNICCRQLPRARLGRRD